MAYSTIEQLQAVDPLAADYAENTQYLQDTAQNSSQLPGAAASLIDSPYPPVLNSLTRRVLGEEQTREELADYLDWQYLTPAEYTQKRGIAAYENKLRELEQIKQIEADSRLARSRTWGEAVGDTAKNTAIGIGSGALDAASFIASAIPGETGNQISRNIAQASEHLGEFGEKSGSFSELAAGRLYAATANAITGTAQRNYNQNIARGMDASEAKLEREGEIAAKTISLLSDSPVQGGKIVTQGLSSFALSALGARGVEGILSGMGKAAIKAAPSLVKAGAKFIDDNDLVLTRAAPKALPWMVSSGVQEGSNTYRETLNRYLNTPTAEFRKNPDFNARVEEYMRENNVSREEAEEAVKLQISVREAQKSGIDVANVAAALGAITKGLAHPFKAKPVTQRFVETLASFNEEATTEAENKKQENLAIKRYLNPNQDEWEGVGQSAAEGAFGALGEAGTNALGGISDLGYVAKESSQKLSDKFTVRQLKKDINKTSESLGGILDAVEKQDKKVGEEYRKTYTDTFGTLSKGLDTISNGDATTEEIIDAFSVIKDARDKLSGVDTTISNDLTTSKQTTLGHLDAVMDGLLTKQQRIVDANRKLYPGQRTDQGVNITPEQLLAEATMYSLLSQRDEYREDKDKQAAHFFDHLPEDLDSLMGSFYNWYLNTIAAVQQGKIKSENLEQIYTAQVEKIFGKDQPDKANPILQKFINDSFGHYQQIAIKDAQEKEKAERDRQKFDSGNPNPEDVTGDNSKSIVGTDSTTRLTQENRDAINKHLNDPVTAPKGAMAKQALEGFVRISEKTKDRDLTEDEVKELANHAANAEYTLDDPSIDQESAETQDTIRALADKSYALIQNAGYSIDAHIRPGLVISPEAVRQTGARVISKKTDPNLPVGQARLVRIIRPTLIKNPGQPDEKVIQTAIYEVAEGSKQQGSQGTGNNPPGSQEGQNPPSSGEQGSPRDSDPSEQKQANQALKDKLDVLRKAGVKVTRDIILDVSKNIKENNTVPNWTAAEMDSYIDGSMPDDYFTKKGPPPGGTGGGQDIGPRFAESLNDESDEDPEDIIKEAHDNNMEISEDDDGNLVVTPGSTRENRNNFRRIFGEALSKIFTPMRRLHYLWETPNALESVVKKLSTKKGLAEFLGSPEEGIFETDKDGNLVRKQGTAGLSDTGRIVNVLTTETDRSGRSIRVIQDDDIKVNDGMFPEDAQNPLSQVLTLLNPNGKFVQEFYKAFDKVLGDGKGYAHLGMFATKSGDKTYFNPRIKAVLVVAAMHYVASTLNRKHTLTPAELRRNGIDPEMYAEMQEKLDGVPETVAIQGLMTNIRKFWGVSFANILDNTTREQQAQVLAELAALTHIALKEASFIETEESPLIVQSIDNTGTLTPVKLNMVRPIQQLSGLLRFDRDILESIFSSEFKHDMYVNEDPVLVTTIAHTAVRVSKKSEGVIKTLNQQEHNLNMPCLGLEIALGGLDGSADFFGLDTSENNHSKSNKESFVTAKGQKLTRALAFEAIGTVIRQLGPGFTGDLGSVPIKYANEQWVNGRYGQRGSSTPQASKPTRALISAVKAHQDLSNADNLREWKITLAQNLGISTGKEDFAKYEKAIDQFITAVESVLSNPTYAALWAKAQKAQSRTRVLTTGVDLRKNEECKDIVFTALERTQFEQMLNEIKEKSKVVSDEDINKGGFDIKKGADESLNALVETIRYVQARKDGKDGDFTSYLAREVDGKNDGPSYLNALFALAAGAFTSAYFQMKAKTGTFHLVDMTTAQGDTNSYGINGDDSHKEVANQKLPENLMKQIVALNNESAGDDAVVTEIKKRIRSMLTLMDMLGWLELPDKNEKFEDALDRLMGLTSLPNNMEDYPIRWKRNIQIKKGTMAAVYGSMPKGMSRTWADFLISGVIGQINDALHQIAGTAFAEPAGVKEFLSLVRNNDYFVVDTESTGTDPTKDKVRQISITKYNRKGEVQESKTFWIKAEKGDPEIPEKFGMDNNPLYTEYPKHAAEAISIQDAFDQMNAFLATGGKNPVVVGHNIKAYDKTILEQHAGKEFGKNVQFADTLEVMRSLSPGSKKSNRLQDLAKEFHIDLEGSEPAHLAGADVATTGELVKKLIPIAVESMQEFEKAKKEAGDNFDPKSIKFGSGDANHVSLTYEQMLENFKQMFDYIYAPSQKGGWTFAEDKALVNFPEHLPNRQELIKGYKYDRKHKVFYTEHTDKDGHVVRDTTYLQNAEISTKGWENITNLLNQLVGKALHAGISESLGATAMQGAKIPMTVASAIASLQRGVEALLISQAGGIDKMTRKQNAKFRKSMQAMTPVFTLPQGVKVVVSRKQFFTASQPLFKNDQLTVLPSATMHASVGVAGGPLITQAMGDATMVTELYSQMSSENALMKVMQCFDGMYVISSDAKKMEEMTNKAVSKALQQKVVNTIVDRLFTIGAWLQKSKLVKATSPEDAIVTALSNLSMGRNIDGSEITNPDLKRALGLEKDANDRYPPGSIITDIIRLKDTLTQTLLFDPELVNQTRSKFNAHESNAAEDVIRNDWKEIFQKLKVCATNELLNHAALSVCSTMYQHCTSGSGGSYTQGKLMSDSTAQNMVREFNTQFNMDSTSMFHNFAELLSAYMNTLVQELMQTDGVVDLNSADGRALLKLRASPRVLTADERAFFENQLNKQGLNTEKNSEKVLTNYKKSLKRQKDTREHAQRRKPKPKAPKTVVAKNTKNVTEYLKVAYEAYRKNTVSLFKDKRMQRLFSSILNRILSLIPKTTSVQMVASFEDLPDIIKSRSKNKDINGAYYDGVMYIIDRSGSMDPMHEKNIETIVHEGVHAALSSIIYAFVNGGWLEGRMTTTQKLAFAALEKLLQQLDRLTWSGEGAEPAVITQLKKIIHATDADDPNLSKEERAHRRAVRLDEGITYIISNARVLKELSQAKFSNTPDWQETKNLVTSVLDAVKTVWKRILKIVPKSLGDKLISNDDTYLGLVFSDTFVILNEEQRTLNDEGQRGDPTRVLKEKQDVTKKTFRESRKALDKYGFFSTDLSKYRPEDIFKKLFLNKEFFNTVGSLNNWDFTSPMFVNELFKKFPKAIKASQDKLKLALEKYQEYGFRLKDYYKTTFPGSSDDEAKFFAISALEFSNSIILSPKDRHELTDLYVDISENLTMDDLYEGDLSHATPDELAEVTSLYKAIKEPFASILESNYVDSNGNTRKLKPEILVAAEFERPAMFYALLMTSPRLQKALRNFKQNKVNYKTQGKGTFADRWFNLGHTIINNMINRALNTQSPEQQVDARIRAYENLRQSEPDTDPLSAMANAFFGITDELWDASFRFLINTLAKVPENKKLTSEDTEVTNATRLQTYNSRMESLRHLVNKLGSPVLVNFFSQAYARVPSNSKVHVLLKKIKNFFDKHRNAELKFFTEKLMGEFKHHKMTKAVRQQLYSSLALTSAFRLSNAEAKEFFTDKSKLDAQIQQVTKELAQKVGKDTTQYYIRKIQEYAGYRMAGENHRNILTNPLAISRGFGERNMHPKSDAVVQDIAYLMTLYKIKRLDPTSLETLQELYKDDGDAIGKVLNAIREVMDKEQDRTSEYHEVRSMDGWLPKGNLATGDYRLVPKRLLDKFTARGYIYLGDYDNSAADPTEKYVRVYSTRPHPEEFQEGLFQIIDQTSYGYQISNRTRGEVPGARITGDNVLPKMRDAYKSSAKVAGLYAIPIYNISGEVVGYDRAIPPEDYKRIYGNTDIFSGIAQYRTRQLRESAAADINTVAADLAYEDWANATPAQRKTEFVDLLDIEHAGFLAKHIDARLVKEALNKLDVKTLSRIRQLFGGHFYVRKDVVYSYIGYRKKSVEDIFDNNFFLPNAAENIISGMLTGMFGPKIRHYLANAEAFLEAAATYARETIIIRSVKVPAMNAAMNTLLLHFALNIPWKDIARLMKESFLETEQYNRLHQEELDLQYAISNATTTAEKEELEQKLENNRLKQQNLTIYKLINEGEYSDVISQNARIIEEVEVTKANLMDRFEHLADKLSKTQKGALGNLLMTRNSELYQLMAKTVNYGDWIAKCIGYKYMTELSKNNKSVMTHAQAVNIVSTLFVDYDQFATPGMDYLNRTGNSWFMMYKYRILPAAIFAMTANPTRMLLGTMGISAIGGSTPLTDNWIYKLLSGDLGYSFGFGMIFRGIAMHPLAVLLGCLI